MHARRISKCLFVLALCAASVPALAETTAYSHFTLIDGTGHAPLPDAAMIVSDGRIDWIGAGAALKTPAGTKAVNLKGKFVIPGLIDNHVHLGNTRDAVQDAKFNTVENVEGDLRTYASYGITTVQVLGTDKDLIFGLRARQRAGRPSMARVFTAGQGIVYKDSYGGVAGINHPVANAAEAATAVDVQAAKGVDFIKFWFDDEHGTMAVKMPYDVAKAVIDEAHKKHLKVVAHIFYLADAKKLAGYGVDGFVHGVRDARVDQALLDAMTQHHTWQMAATLSREASFTYTKLPFLDDPFFARGVSAASLAAMKSPAHQKDLAASPEFASYKGIFKNAMANFKTEADAGIAYGMGTDSGPPGRFPGYFAHWELALMVKAGLTPMQALVAATGGNARWLGDNDIGTLAPAKWADFVVLDADPTQDIANTRKISAVYIAGQSVPTIWSKKP